MNKPVKITRHIIEVFAVKDGKPKTSKDFIVFQSDSLTILQIFVEMQRKGTLPQNHRKVGLALADSQHEIGLAFDTQTPTAEVLDTAKIVEQLKGML
jgi:hypothetical protein